MVEAIKPYPFCGDPMEWTGSFVRHVNYSRWNVRALTTAQAEIGILRDKLDTFGRGLAERDEQIEARDALLRECLRWLPLLESHEPGSTTDLLCDRIRATLGEQP